MRRPVVFLTSLLLTAVALAPASRASLLCKEYHFKEGVTLEIGESTQDGLRVDSVRFRLPATSGTEYQRTGGVVKVDVAVSNTSGGGLKAGIAVALFDEANRLVGVASGGSKLMSVRAGRQKSYTLVFDDVNTEAYKAKTFLISVESK